MPLRSLQDLDLKDKRVLLRVDFNVPLNDNGQITDPTRIEMALPTIQYILKQNAKLIIMSHMGRPHGKVNPKLSLKPCAEKLSELLGKDVKLAPDSTSEKTKTLAMAMQPGNVLLLENLRFHKEEEHPEEDPSFVEKLKSLGDVYVSDAFGCAHRKHASIYGLPKLFGENAGAGFLMEREISGLSSLTLHPKRPFYAILGGAKLGTKLGVLKALLPKVDGLFIGGGMAFTFLKAQGISIGDSLCDDLLTSEAKSIMQTCQEKAIKFWLPKDFVISSTTTDQIESASIKDGIPDGFQGMDIGQETLADWSEHLKSAATVFWNGPMGVFEVEDFAHGTNQLAQSIANLDANTIIGGGDSVAAIHKLGLNKFFTHISSGGGAALEFIEFGKLPGTEILSL